MIVMPGRGEHRPQERQHRRSMVEFCSWCAVAFTQLVTILVVDGSYFVSSGAVNPALTTMANALRVGDHLLERLGATRRSAPATTAA